MSAMMLVEAPGLGWTMSVASASVFLMSGKTVVAVDVHGRVRLLHVVAMDFSNEFSGVWMSTQCGMNWWFIGIEKPQKLK